MTNLYSSLSEIGFLKKNYSLKFLFVAFIGIHIPLIIITLISATDIFTFNKMYVLLAILFATLAASALTLFFLNKLLWPLREAKNALTKYVFEKEIPQLPIQFEDEAGILLRELQYTIEHLDYLIEEKKDVATILSNDIREPFEQFFNLSTRIIEETDSETIRQNAITIKQVSIKNLLTLNGILTFMETNRMQNRKGVIYESRLKNEK
jgi:hypothetical protein